LKSVSLLNLSKRFRYEAPGFRPTQAYCDVRRGGIKHGNEVDGLFSEVLFINPVLPQRRATILRRVR